jgi:DNA polymerase-4
MGREILHVNTDDFYASALRLRDPRLRGRPVVVAGPAPRGMVLSASYEARGEGVRRGMTVSAAMRLCSGASFLPPDWPFFRKVSAGIFSVLNRYSPLVEAVSLDEGYLDYSGCGRVFGHVLDVGGRIRKELKAETGLDVSLGIGSSRLVSHVASRTAKRSHLVDVYPGGERPFLAPVEIDRFPVVAERQVPLLRELGISRVGDILLFTEEMFSFCFGPWGRRLYRAAGGEDETGVRDGRGRGAEFRVERLLEPDLVDRRLLESFISMMAEGLGEKLRAGRSLAGSLLLELRYADGMTVSGRGRMAVPSSDDGALFDAAGGIFDRLFSRRVRVRSLELAAGSMEPEPLQLGLFADDVSLAADKTRRLRSALDRLRSALPEGVAPVSGRSFAAHLAGKEGAARR